MAPFTGRVPGKEEAAFKKRRERKTPFAHYDRPDGFPGAHRRMKRYSSEVKKKNKKNFESDRKRSRTV